MSRVNLVLAQQNRDRRNAKRVPTTPEQMEARLKELEQQDKPKGHPHPIMFTVAALTAIIVATVAAHYYL
jgi:hypothetical protein